MKNRWTPRETLLLVMHYPEASMDIVIRALPGRTWSAIKCKANDIHISRSAQGNRYSKPVDVDAISHYYLRTGCTIKVLMRVFGITRWKASSIIDSVIKNQKR